MARTWDYEITDLGKLINHDTNFMICMKCLRCQNKFHTFNPVQSLLCPFCGFSNICIVDKESEKEDKNSQKCKNNIGK